MAKIHSLKISNFRGIKSFEQTFWNHDFICLVGRGDSGKTTILEAISYVLSPSWNLTFYDTDFFNCDITQNIEIEVSLYNLPEKLMQEDRFGLYQRFINTETSQIQDEPIDDAESIITIKLMVNNDLEPRWFVISSQHEEKDISASDRAKLNVFLVSDYINQHFSWNKGTPLYSLLKEQDINEHGHLTIIDALRGAKEKIDEVGFNYLNPIVNIVKDNASNLGLNINNSKTSIDFKDIYIHEGRICLHDEKIPFRLKGKGSKRLISIAIQSTLARFGGITLIDEIEQGLEPDRVKHLVRTLFCENKKNNGQIFITTHSQNVIEELECENLLRLNYNNGIIESMFIPEEDKYQSLVRTCQPAIYAQKVIVCEGKTEIGICRALDSYRIKTSKETSKKSMTTNDVVCVDGSGSSFTDRALKLKEIGIEVCVLCDSDRDNELNPNKTVLRSHGIEVFEWESGKSIERQVIDDLPWDGVFDMIKYRIKDLNNNKQQVMDSIKIHYQDGQLNNCDSPKMREAIFKAMTHKKIKANGNEEDKSWFKRIDHGEALGDIIFKYFDSMKTENLKLTLVKLSNWIGNV